MRKELLRQAVHLVYGVLFTFVVAWNVWIGLGATLLAIVVLLAHRKRELPLVEALVRALDRNDDTFPGFGAITLTGGITSVFLILPEYALVAGLGIAVIDSIATAIGVIGESKRKKLAASLTGGLVYFIIATSAFSQIPTGTLALAIGAGTLAEFFTTRRMILDDNVTVTWAIALALALL